MQKSLVWIKVSTTKDYKTGNTSFINKKLNFNPDFKIILIFENQDFIFKNCFIIILSKTLFLST